ncbi:MAG: DEAD/DEAH box helicase [Solirubrobacteraceae bacterium]|nr:DEAD/DEAH box helicase [Solirubrobacteraceae bacterium]
MTTPEPVEGWLDVERLGSHFVLGVSDAAAPPALASPLGERGVWSVPAVPGAAAALRAFLEAHPAVYARPAAERLLRDLDLLPTTATAAVHACEHRPGRAGFMVVGEQPSAVARAVAPVPGVRHDAKLGRWWMPDDAASAAALCSALATNAWIAPSDEVRSRLAPAEQMSLTPAAASGLRHRCVLDVELTGDEARLRLCRLCHPALEPVLASLGAPPARSLDSWYAPIAGATAAALRGLLDDRPELGADAALTERFDAALAVVTAAEAMERLSAATGGEAAAGATALRPFQAAGVEYALRARRTFIADEPGLGKTLQALTTLETGDGFPALVVCPASLRLNWMREAARWLPDRTVGEYGGGTANDIDVVSYDVLHRLVAALTRRPPRALVLDESHYCKNPAARRTRAAQAVAAALPADALVLLLTGTPIVNRPTELASQLQILGRLDEVGGARRLATVHARGEDLDGLHRRLRRTCFVRRHKRDVLSQLPAKQRVVVALELSNRGEYERVRRDVLSWLRAEAEADAAFAASVEHLRPAERQEAIHARGREAHQRARRAEALVRIGKLSLVAARGKLDAATEWIETFLANDEKLVVFCRHREIGDHLHAAFPDAALATGRVNAAERHANVTRFQADPGCRLLIGSFDAAGVGLTLTAASNVAFAEMAWTPAVHDQAEDRVHRIGQSSAVTAWYLLAADTIDERIAATVADKRRLIGLATDGISVAQATTVDDLLGWIAEPGVAA